MLSPLPIDPLIPEIVASLARTPVVVVIAPPGAGKTTRLPPAILDAPFMRGSGEGSRLILLQPRRVAARAAAARIAHEREWQVGQQVGYQIRFENRTTARTRLHVVTEGILTRRLQSDPFLEGVGCVILDEFHERSIHTDVALAMLREIQSTVRPDLRLVVMSATVDPCPIASFLGEAPIFESPGRLHPVEIEYIPRALTQPVSDGVADAARAALMGGEGSGHTLVFLPGIAEIRRTAARLHGVDAELHILHSSVSARDQDRALAPSDRRKLILATNIAETSLTIDAVRTVIDSGLVRLPIHDARLGIDRLELRRISQASADQRAGRAGRTAPGRCLRLWTRSENAALADHELPEIHRLDLSATLLALHLFGARDPRRFGWFDPPREAALARAEEPLTLLGALDGEGSVTDLGRRLATLPLHPRLGCLLLEGNRRGVLPEAALVAALLSERDILPASARTVAHEGLSDLLPRIDALQHPESATPADAIACKAILRVADELRRSLGRASPPGPSSTSPDPPEKELLRAVLHAYPDRVTRRRSQDPTRGVMVGSRGIVLDPVSVVRRTPLFLSLDPQDPPAGGGEARVRLASAVEETWLAEDFPHLYARLEICRFDPQRGKVLAFREIRFAGLTLREDIQGAPADPTAASAALHGYLKDKPALWLDNNETAQRWLARLAVLRRWMPELYLPEINDEILDEALASYCNKISSLAELKQRDLRPSLESRLTPAQRTAIHQHAPETITVPSGSQIRLDYSAEGEAPALAVRLQEMFGLAETPRIAAGRCAVRLHLLAPNRRPVQTTSDLRNFWNTTYHEIRRDFRAPVPQTPLARGPMVRLGRGRRTTTRLT